MYSVKSFDAWGESQEEQGGSGGGSPVSPVHASFLGDDCAFTSKAGRIRAEEQQRECVRKSKLRSGPFDSHVVEAVRRAMHGV
jgi:hypothetical protein